MKRRHCKPPRDRLAKLSDITKLEKLVLRLHKPKRPTLIHFGFRAGLPRPKGTSPMPLDLSITNEQKITVTLNPVTDTGRAVTLDGEPTWSVESGDSRVDVAPGGLSAELISADDPGDTVIIVTADADLGEGVVELSDVIRLSVVGATAKNLGLTAGEPTGKII